MKNRIYFIYILFVLICSAVYGQNIEWEQKANLPRAMRGSAISCNNRIYFFEADTRKSGVYEYNPLDDSWKWISYMNIQGWNVNLVEHEGVIYVIGGDPFRDRFESYDPTKNEWTTLKAMPTGRQHSNSCVIQNKIYVMGGITDWTSPSNKNEVYHFNSDSWKTASPLPHPSENPIISSVNSMIYALCGDLFWMYDTSLDSWVEKDKCPAWVSVLFGSAVIDEYIIIPGGQNLNEQAVSSVYIFNTTLQSWIQSNDLPKPFQLGGITTLNGKIYIIGGCDSNFSPYNTVFEGTLID